MIPSEIRDMSIEDMQKKVLDLKEAYFNLRFQHETGQLENTNTLKKTRQDIARIITIINETKK
ncbi:MAG: 50S ribosomal protein L29 [Desulfobacterales bacterium]|jgi:large subunit ribosomal protein L29|nr:50S ribosomal protein L29 [Desulfobacteraceae bacterium]MBT4364083.1 50S ribosomal protein L29 [Desulfobacteraceae bacterium]MBT7086357.1 50S ribosomal protein L29 [Desulfobacterales bacterium]MBT7696278.1 50S ribosomal protein L29 [Desulfobacterales bacterium]